MPNQPPEALLEFNDRLRRLIITKRITSSRFDGFQASFQERMIRHTERQPRNNHVLKRITGNIHTLPEAVGPKQDGSLIGTKAFQHCRTRQSLSLAIERQIVLRQPAGQTFCTALHHRIAGKQHECATFGLQQMSLNAITTLLFESLRIRSRVSHISRQNEACLLLVIERTSLSSFIAFGQPDSRTEKSKVFCAGRQRCTGHHH